MKNMSLRMRLTLSTVLVLSAIAVLITSFSMYNAERMVEPISQGLYNIDGGMEVIKVKSMDVFYATESYSVLLEDFSTTNSSTSPAATAVPGMGADDSGTGGAVVFDVGDVTHSIQVAATAASGLVQDGEALQSDIQLMSVTVQAAKKSFDYTSVIVMTLMIAAGGGLVYLVLGFALKPVRALSHNIRDISENRLSERLDCPPAGDEINSLALSFNSMLERLERAFRAQKQFSTAAAHELKTPLAAIQASIDVLYLDENPSLDETRETLEVVKKQTGRMRRLVDDLFAMSSLKDYDINDEVSISEMLTAILQDLAPAIRHKRLAVHVESCGCRVTANAVMLMRALSNVVENAIKYNVNEGQIDITCALSAQSVTIQISDTGAGVSDDQLPHIFDAFFRADNSRSRALGGAGLGLSITREIILYHGGSVEASLNEEGGMTFLVTLPLKPLE